MRQEERVDMPPSDGVLDSFLRLTGVGAGAGVREKAGRESICMLEEPFTYTTFSAILRI